MYSSDLRTGVPELRRRGKDVEVDDRPLFDIMCQGFQLLIQSSNSFVVQIVQVQTRNNAQLCADWNTRTRTHMGLFNRIIGGFENEQNSNCCSIEITPYIIICRCAPSKSEVHPGTGETDTLLPLLLPLGQILRKGRR